MQSSHVECAILGAGAAGLAAAHELTANGIRDVLVVDRHSVPGGLSRTVTFSGARFDIGPHRFYTHVPTVQRLWRETLGSDFLSVRRSTRILYNEHTFQYPLEPIEVLRKLGLRESAASLGSFIRERFRSNRQGETYEDWIVHQFGRELYDRFFRSYTEKVWGIPGNRVSAEWASQRIKGLSFSEIIRNALIPDRRSRTKTLIEQFDYPRNGSGQFYERLADRVRSNGGSVMLGSEVIACIHNGSCITEIKVRTSEGTEISVLPSAVFSSLPITKFMHLLQPQLPQDILDAAGLLTYRHHLTVDLLIDRPNVFQDQWMYVHTPSVRMARIANFKNFSPAMVDDPRTTGLSIEYFAFDTDDLWRMSDTDLGIFATEELTRLGLIEGGTVMRSQVIRETESYPAYHLGFRAPLAVLRTAIEQFSNLTPIGRGGLFKYNNQDHSTMSGIVAARLFLGLASAGGSVWDVDADQSYFERGAYGDEAGS